MTDLRKLMLEVLERRNYSQATSEYTKLTEDERMKGMEVLAKAAQGTKPALVLGVQGGNMPEMLQYARHAEKLDPDAVIVIPPTEGKSIEELRAYYRALCRTAKRPLFIQTSAGPKGLEPSTGFIVELAREFPNFGYVKEELKPLIPRMLEMAKPRPAIKAVFSGIGDWPSEMRLGFDGMMPGAPIRISTRDSGSSMRRARRASWKIYFPACSR